MAAPPAGMHLILCSRLDPLLSLGAVRSAGNLREIRVDQLRYSPEETAAALRGSGVCLTRAQVRAAHACTGGWPAGVRLVAAALRTGGDPDTFLSGSPRIPGPSGTSSSARCWPPCRPRTGRRWRRWAWARRPTRRSLTGSPATGLVAKMSEPGAGFRVDALVQAHLQAEFRPRSTPAGTGDRTALRWIQAEDDPVGTMDDAMRAADVPLLVELVHRFTGLFW